MLLYIVWKKYNTILYYIRTLEDRNCERFHKQGKSSFETLSFSTTAICQRAQRKAPLWHWLEVFVHLLWYIITLPSIVIELFFPHCWGYRVADRFLTCLFLETPQPSLGGMSSKNETFPAVVHTRLLWSRWNILCQHPALFMFFLPLADVPAS